MRENEISEQEDAEAEEWEDEIEDKLNLALSNVEVLRQAVEKLAGKNINDYLLEENGKKGTRAKKIED